MFLEIEKTKGGVFVPRLFHAALLLVSLKKTAGIV